MWFYIILGIIYIVIGIVMFFIFSAYDLFDEYVSYKRMEFPCLTFVASLFWVISIPMIIASIVVSIFLEWIEVWGYAIRDFAAERERKKKKERTENDE